MLYFDHGNLLNEIWDLIARNKHKNKFGLFSKINDLINEKINKQKLNNYDSLNW